VPAQESLLGEGTSQALRNARIGLVHEFLDQLRGLGGVEDIMFDGDVLIIQLLQEAERRNGLTAGTQAFLAELPGQNLRELLAPSYRIIY
jgi:hypothetical protein